jgi:hypothetical protein
LVVISSAILFSNVGTSSDSPVLNFEGEDTEGMERPAVAGFTEEEGVLGASPDTRLSLVPLVLLVLLY